MVDPIVKAELLIAKTLHLPAVPEPPERILLGKWILHVLF
jgi:hypothetical protein